MAKQSLLIPIIVLTLATGCRLTRTDVIGKWTSQWNDTLIVNSNNSFLFIKGSFNKINLTDSTQSHLSGYWTLQKKAIHFEFADTTQNFGGGCTTYQYWWTRGSKKNLVIPSTCKYPTNRFIVIRKIE